MTVRGVLAKLCNDRAKSILGYRADDYADKDITQALLDLQKLIGELKKNKKHRWISASNTKEDLELEVLQSGYNSGIDSVLGLLRDEK